MKTTPKTGYAGLMQAAQGNWPEDEAAGTFETLRDRLEDFAQDAEETQWAVEAFGRDVEHMRKVFGREADSEQLIARYEAALARHLVSDSHTADVTFQPMFPSLPL
jgi:hypothetical protein